MKKIVWIPILSLLILPACESNPTLADPREDVFTAELELSTGHAHTLTEIGFTLTIRNGLGDLVTDFESLALQRRFGEGSWRDIDLTPQGQSFVGGYTFSSSGEYHFRVMATRHGATEAEVPFLDHEMGELHVGRAHVEIEGVRFEFESFPGHLHEGDESIIRFWVKEAEKDANGVRQAITGFQGDIVCGDPGGFTEEHHPHETEPGVYEAVHTWTEAGDASATFRFASDDGHSHGATFEFHVVHAH